MSSTERTIRVRFGGDARGLKAAAKDGEVSVSAWQRQLDRARASLGGASKASNEFGQAAEANSKRAATAAASLDRQIGTLRGSLRGLAVDFAEGGDSGIAKQMRAAEREMRKLTKARSLIGDGDDDGVKTGLRFGARFAEGAAAALARAGGPISSGLSSVFGSLPPQAQVAIGATVVAGVASVAPLVGGVIAGAVVGGVGIGGVVGGFAIASQHADVKAAAKSTGDALKETMQRSAVAFVPATVGALGIVRAEVTSMGGDFERIFSKAARFVAPLTRGVTGFLKNLLPGIEDAVDRAGPVIDEISAWGPRLGTLMSDVFTMFARHATEAASALRLFWGVLETGTRYLAGTIAGLTVAHGWLEKLGAAASLNLPRLAALVAEEKASKLAADGAAPSMFSLDQIMAGFGTSAQDAATKTGNLLSALSQLTGAASAGRQANMDFETGLDALSESVKNNGTTLDVTQGKGRANLQVIESLISAADRAGTAAEQRALAENASATVAAAAGARMRETFIADLQAAADKAGLSKDRVAAMVRELQEADGKRIRINIEQHIATFGKPYSDNVGIGGNTFRGFAGGGRIGGRGTATSDSNLAAVSKDEYVLNARAARRIGYNRLDRLNRLGGGEARSVLADRDYLAGGGGRGMGGGSAGGGGAGGDTHHVYVEIDGQQLEGRIVHVVSEANRGLKRRVLAGPGM